MTKNVTENFTQFSFLGLTLNKSSVTEVCIDKLPSNQGPIYKHGDSGQKYFWGAPHPKPRIVIG